MSEPTDSSETPLLGKSILLTRPEGQSDRTQLAFESLGAEVVTQPVIQILPPSDFRELDDCLERLEQFDWLVFVSPNAAKFFIERFRFKQGSLDRLHEKKVAAIGASTLQALQTHSGQKNWKAALIPETSNSSTLGHELAAQAKGQRLLIPRVDQHSETLGNRLKKSGIEFEQPLTYRHADVESAHPNISKRLADGQFDWVTITSPAIAGAAVKLFGNSLLKSRLASISPRASKALKSFGHSEIIESKTPNIKGVIAAIVEFENANED